MNALCIEKRGSGSKAVPTQQKKKVFRKDDIVTHKDLQGTIAWVNKGGRTAAVIMHKVGRFCFPPHKWNVKTSELQHVNKKLFLVKGQVHF